MAENDRLFPDHGAAEWIMASPHPCEHIREHIRFGRGVHNFDCAIWDHVQEDAIFTGAFTRFTHNSTMKQHLLSTGTKRLAEANPFEPVWGIGRRAEDPEAQCSSQ